MALSSSDRGQTLHLASTDSMVVSEDKVEFIIRKPTKTTRKVLKPLVISCISNPEENLNVAHFVKCYLEATKDFRGDYKSLFLSWKTRAPVVKASLARWLTLVLELAGIDTSTFKAHSYRGASLSNAYRKGATLQQILNAGNWTNASTFNRFYNAPSCDSEIGRLVLDN